MSSTSISRFPAPCAPATSTMGSSAQDGKKGWWLLRTWFYAITSLLQMGNLASAPSRRNRKNLPRSLLLTNHHYITTTRLYVLLTTTRRIPHAASSRRHKRSRREERRRSRRRANTPLTSNTRYRRARTRRVRLVRRKRGHRHRRHDLGLHKHGYNLARRQPERTMIQRL